MENKSPGTDRSFFCARCARPELGVLSARRTRFFIARPVAARRIVRTPARKHFFSIPLSEGRPLCWLLPRSALSCEADDLVRARRARAGQLALMPKRCGRATPNRRRGRPSYRVARRCIIRYESDDADGEDLERRPSRVGASGVYRVFSGDTIAQDVCPPLSFDSDCVRSRTMPGRN